MLYAIIYELRATPPDCVLWASFLRPRAWWTPRPHTPAASIIWNLAGLTAQWYRPTKAKAVLVNRNWNKFVGQKWVVKIVWGPLVGCIVNNFLRRIYVGPLLSVYNPKNPALIPRMPLMRVGVVSFHWAKVLILGLNVPNRRLIFY